VLFVEQLLAVSVEFNEAFNLESVAKSCVLDSAVTQLGDAGEEG
jgi:hypothetical protein